MTKLETLKQQTADLEAKLEETTEKLKSMKAEIDRLENGWEMKYPFKNGQHYFVLCQDGDTIKDSWVIHILDKKRFLQGSVFKTEEAALLESKRRNLLTRFRAFRDERNDGWEPDWMSGFYNKYFLKIRNGVFSIDYYVETNMFHTFGYFKNKEDAQRAIDLFGDEIKELFM